MEESIQETNHVLYYFTPLNSVLKEHEINEGRDCGRIRKKPTRIAEMTQEKQKIFSSECTK